MRNDNSIIFQNNLFAFDRRIQLDEHTTTEFAILEYASIAYRYAIRQDAIIQFHPVRFRQSCSFSTNAKKG